MPEFFLELFSEEIPARMQARIVDPLKILIKGYLSEIWLPDTPINWFLGPRRIALQTVVQPQTISVHSVSLNSDRIRGPRIGAPEAAVEGFLNKNASGQPIALVRERMIEEDGYYRLLVETTTATRSAADVILEKLQPALAKLPWPKSMRWGCSGDFTWIRPLRRSVCLLDGKVVPIILGPVTASNETEGHRFLAPGAFAVTSATDWQAKLRERYVIVSADERKKMILDSLHAKAAKKSLSLVEDQALLDEVTGLVEWPVSLIGHIDPQFMNLPPEVRELSMKVNQRYFALRDMAGKSAPCFAFVANIEAEDGGTTITAGNERVLRARLADAEHFWNLDRQHPLSDFLPKLKSVTFHAKLGTQLERAERIAALSRKVADLLNADRVEAQQAEMAGRLAKADLVTGMVGEFPELQGIMGGYYANDSVIGPAISTHYQPKGPDDEVPNGLIACSVALADKLDMLREFFRVGEKPTGSGDPYALRRAALGVIRIIRENSLNLHLKGLCGESADVFDFLIERLRVLLRSEGERHDVLDAVFAAGKDDDINSLLDKTQAVSKFLHTEDGGNLLTAYRRAANILKIENSKDGPHEGNIIEALLHDPAERDLNEALKNMETQTEYEQQQRGYNVLLAGLATLRMPVDAFFEAVKINTDDPELRGNRLRLLAKLRDTMHTIADFSKTEG